MDHLMDMEVMEKAADAETALKQVKECIKFKDSKGLKTVILEHKLKDQSVFWEITSELTANLTEENLEQHEYFFETCQRCMNYVIANGNPKELLLAVLEQADSFKDDQKFKCILENVQKILLKLPNKRHHSLDVTLETLSAHIEAIPQAKDHNLDHEERKLLEMDPSVMRATDVVLCYLEFLSPFVEEVSMRNPKVTFSKSTPQVQLLVKYLMKLLSHPLYHLDMTFKPKEQEEKEKSYSRVCAERLIDQLAQLCPNFFALIEDETNKRSMRAKLKESEAREDEENEGLEEEGDDKVKDWKEDKLIPENSLACLSYLVLAEGLGLDRMPAVYNHKFMLRFHLPFIKSFLVDQHSIVKLKGVLLLEKLMLVIPPMSFTHYELDNDFYKDILNLLISTMTHCQNKDIRKSCVPIYSNFFGMFSLQGRHRLYETVFNTCKHSGVVGHTLSLYKEQVDSLLKKGEGPENIFLGKNLIRVFKLVSTIPDGVTTDLLENSDRILSVLNFVRYLVLRDNPAENRTGIWELYPNLDKEFFEPLRQAIILSKGHYNLDLEDVRKGNPLPTENTEFSVNVGGERLGPVSREQQIQVIDSALNTFDMMDSILSRTIELADAQKRSVKANQADTLSRCNRNGGRFMCTSTGDRNPPQGTSNGPGGSASSQTSNGGYNAQGMGQGTQYTDELDNSEDLLNEVEEEEMPEETEEEYQTKQAVLKASLPFVHQYGWTKKAIVAGAESLGMPPVVHGMFPRGGAELVFYFYEESNKDLESFLKQKVKELKEKDEKIKTGPFIHDAIETRLRMIIPYIDKWPQAMAIQTLPQNAVQSWTNLSRVVDDIWFYAGDKSNDFNWYTKRVSLATVYKSTEIYLIQDRSEDYTDTWNFLENRLEDVVNAGHIARNLQETNTVLSEGAKGFCLMTRNLLGMNNR